jgi:hypothetical protein
VISVTLIAVGVVRITERALSTEAGEAEDFTPLSKFGHGFVFWKLESGLNRELFLCVCQGTAGLGRGETQILTWS